MAPTKTEKSKRLATGYFVAKILSKEWTKMFLVHGEGSGAGPCAWRGQHHPRGSRKCRGCCLPLSLILYCLVGSCFAGNFFLAVLRVSYVDTNPCLCLFTFLVKLVSHTDSEGLVKRLLENGLRSLFMHQRVTTPVSTLSHPHGCLKAVLHRQDPKQNLGCLQNPLQAFTWNPKETVTKP